MRNIDEHTITDAFRQRLDSCDNPRLAQIMTSLVAHLHEFAREVRLTEAEWMQGIDFLTRTGHMCDSRRQEFILLSDTLGLSMLVVSMNNAKPEGATEATVLGPFHVDDAPRVEQGTDIAAGAPGVPMDVDITVQSIDGTPLASAEVDVWQADDEGLYDVQRAGLETRRSRAVLRTDGQGRLRFRTLLPTAYPVPTDGPVGQMLVARSLSGLGWCPRRGESQRQTRRRRGRVAKPHNEPATKDGAANRPGPKGWACKGAQASLQMLAGCPTRLRFAPSLRPLAGPTRAPPKARQAPSGRHPWRPAHLHFLIKADGHETLVTHLFRDGDPYLDSDVVFGVRNSLVVPMPAGRKPGARPALNYRFVMNRVG